MTLSIGTIALICVIIFIAGIIDSIAGGGGLITLPAYLSVGIPPHLALATNKFSSASGTFISFIRFVRGGKINWKSALAAVAGALPGSFLGAKLILIVDEIYLRYLLLAVLPLVAVLVLRNKRFGESDKSGRHSNPKLITISLLIGLVTGTYDGFFGPGTGTFLILAFTGLIGFNLATASGNTKVVNLASNVGALSAFIISGNVLYAVGIPAAIAGILGNWIGSGLAIKGGAKIIRPVFIFVVALLFIKIIYDMV